MDLIPAAWWLRVSTDDQSSDPQIPELERFSAHRGYDPVKRFVLSDSAWKNDVGGPEYRAALKALLEGAWRGDYKVVVVWALDRIVRTGAEDTLRLIRQLRERGCMLVSVQESWLGLAPEIQDVLVAFAGWVAQQESRRRSERIRIGIENRKAQGLPVGRKAGAKDLKPRKKSGYYKSWEDRKESA